MEGVKPKASKKSVTGGSRGVVLFCLHDSLNKLGFEVRASFDRGELCGIVAGTKAFMAAQIPGDPCRIPPPTDADFSLDSETDPTL